jgi:hypothetical protein
VTHALSRATGDDGTAGPARTRKSGRSCPESRVPARVGRPPLLTGPVDGS